MKYGQLPKVVGDFYLECEENLFYLYLPVKMEDTKWGIRIPDQLKRFKPLVIEAIIDSGAGKGDYIYLTAKNMFITPNYLAQRPGYHSDGFMTDDLNYIWYDSSPTIFNNSEFNLTPDHDISLREMEEQADPSKEVIYPCKTLLKLDQYVIHKVAPIDKPVIRTFVKVSISKDRYNLKGNSHNYLFDYKWDMYDRGLVRNDPHKLI